MTTTHPSIPKLYNQVQVAKAVGISTSKIWAMKKAGLKFSHGTLTTAEHILDWMAANPEFRTTPYVRPRREQPPTTQRPRKPSEIAAKYGMA